MSAQIKSNTSAGYTGYEEYEPQYIDKYDMSQYNDAEKAMDQIFKESDEIVDVYINNNIPDLKNIDFKVEGKTRDTMVLNNNFMRKFHQNIAGAGADAGDDDMNNKIEIFQKENLSFIENFKNYNLIVQKNKRITQRYILLNNQLLDKQRKLKLGEKKQFFSFIDNLKFLVQVNRYSNISSSL
jgi:hypothetical protein